MKKHENFLKHREPSQIGVSSDGGIIIKFKDESHTYIDPNNVRFIFTTLSDLVDKGLISYEEE